MWNAYCDLVSLQNTEPVRWNFHLLISFDFLVTPQETIYADDLLSVKLRHFNDIYADKV